MATLIQQPDLAPSPAFAEEGETDLRSRSISLVSVLTLVLWTVALSVGVVGFVLPYARPVPPPPPAPPIQAELLQVELTSDPLPSIDRTPAPTLAEAPPPVALDPVQVPEAPPMVAVAEPSAVVFALPVEGPVAIVEPAHASFQTPAKPAEPAPAPAPAVQTITYGQGEGRQPAPEYPLRARREGQQGTVRVRFTVAETGRVLAAEAAVPCPWDLLNESALRVIRERWRFQTGPIRVYEVAIRFQLTK